MYLSTTPSRDVYFSYLVVDNLLKPLSEDEELGLVMYIAEKERRKPGFLRRETSVESITSILEIKYPFLVKNLNQDYVVVFDLYRDSVLKINYYVLIQEEIEELIREIEYSRERDFLDKLATLEKTAKNIAEVKTHVIEKSALLRNILLNPDIVQELSIIINKTREYSIDSPKLPVREVNVDSSLKEINNVLETCSKIHGYIMSILSRVDKYSEKWRREISTIYSERIRDLEERLSTVKDEVKKRTEEYGNRLREEVDKVIGDYKRLLEDLDKKIIELENKLKSIEEEERRVKEYGGKLSDIKKRKKEIKKELKSLQKKREGYIQKKESDVKNIEEKYSRLIESERSKIIELEEQIKRTNEELESLIKLCNSRVESVREYLLKFIDIIKNIEKKILDSLIATPLKGEGIYWVPIYVVKYRSAAEERVYLVTPLRINPPGRFSSLKFEFFTHIREYLISIRELCERSDYKQLLEEHNLFRKIPIERIENSLKILVNNKIIRSKEYEEVVRRIRDQISMLK